MYLNEAEVIRYLSNSFSLALAVKTPARVLLGYRLSAISHLSMAEPLPASINISFYLLIYFDVLELHMQC